MFKTKFANFVDFLKLSFSEGLIKTAKNNVFNTVVLSSILVVGVFASTLIFNGDIDNASSTNSSSNKPFGEFVADYGFGEVSHVLTKKEFANYTTFIEDGKENRLYIMRSPIKNLKDATVAELMVFQGRDTKNGISFSYQEQGIDFKVVIANVNLKSGYSYMIAKHKTIEPAHKAIFTKIVY